ATSQLRRHPAKLLLTAVAMIAAACTVVWVVSGYDALVSRFDAMADDYLGRYDMFVVPARGRDQSLSTELAGQLAAAPGVAEVTSFYQTPISFKVDRPGDTGRTSREGSGRQRAGRGGGNRVRMDRPALVGIAAAEPPYPLVQ